MEVKKKTEDSRFTMSAVSWPKWPSVHRELRPCSSVCFTLTSSIKVRECIKRPKRAAGLHGQNLHPSETDAVLEYFPSNIFPSLSLSLSDLLSMPMVTLEAL